MIPNGVLVHGDRAAGHHRVDQRRRRLLAEQVQAAAEQVGGGQVGRTLELAERRHTGRKVVLDQLTHTVAGEGAVFAGQQAPGNREDVARVDDTGRALAPGGLERGNARQIGAHRGQEAGVEATGRSTDEKVRFDAMLEERLQSSNVQRPTDSAAAKHECRRHRPSFETVTVPLMSPCAPALYYSRAKKDRTPSAAEAFRGWGLHYSHKNRRMLYWLKGITSRDEVYFRGMYLRLLRTIEFLTHQPEWDGKRILVIGESQGGGQALVAAGLDHRVSAVVAIVPAMCDWFGPLANRKGGWPQPYESNASKEAMQKAIPYFDAANILKGSKAIIFTEIGLIDQTCPSTSVYSAVNQAKGKKIIYAVPYRPHHQPEGALAKTWEDDFHKPREQFISNYLK